LSPRTPLFELVHDNELTKLRRGVKYEINDDVIVVESVESDVLVNPIVVETTELVRRIVEKFVEFRIFISIFIVLNVLVPIAKSE
jgi:hypothetical protein